MLLYWGKYIHTIHIFSDIYRLIQHYDKCRPLPRLWACTCMFMCILIFVMCCVGYYAVVRSHTVRITALLRNKARRELPKTENFALYTKRYLLCFQEGWRYRLYFMAYRKMGRNLLPRPPIRFIIVRTVNTSEEIKGNPTVKLEMLMYYQIYM